MVDVLLISPNSKSLYQELSKDLSAIEPNIWAGLLANAVIAKGFTPAIYDLEADTPKDDNEFKSRCDDFSPKLFLFVCTGSNPNASTASMAGATKSAKTLKDLFPNIPIAFVGPHANALPFEVLEKHEFIDIAFSNEGVYSLISLLENKINPEEVPGLWYRNKGVITANKPSPIVPQDRLSIDLPGVAYDLMPDLSKYRTSNWHTNYCGNESPFASIYTSLGCIYKCLAGDTPVNTIHGMIPIKELAEKYETIPVYTRDPVTHKVLLADAINIQKTGSDQKLLRVEFDDGSHIDCTPDHKFTTFINGNQSVPVREAITEAKDLKPNTRVRAIKQELSAYNRMTIRWARRDFKFRSRLHMEYAIGRELTKKEHVHHKNRNTLDDSLENLEYCENAKAHFEHHPEFSERMKKDNPSKYWTEESKIKASKSLTGIKRTPEQKQRYRESKLGEKNPNYKHGLTCNRSSRLDDNIPNHKVVNVYELDGLHDTYCMEVPNYGWFYANNVLVKNCGFCMINVINRTDNDANKSASNFNTFRYWEPEFIIKQFDYLASKGIKNIKICDEMFVLKVKHCMALCDLLIERDYKFNIWAYTRVDTVKPEYLDRLKRAGINWLALGIESGNETIRKEITKGRFEDVNIRQVVKDIEEAGINRILNYIVGLGHDTWDSMQSTLNLALELNGECSNIYAATALPGSQLYLQAKQEGWELPDDYSGYGFLSYDHLPSRTFDLTAKEVLRFRDYAFTTLFTNPRFLSSIERKFGPVAVQNIQKMTSVKLKRKILGD